MTKQCVCGTKINAQGHDMQGDLHPGKGCTIRAAEHWEQLAKEQPHDSCGRARYDTYMKTALSLRESLKGA